LLEVVTWGNHGARAWRGRVDVKQAEVRHDLANGDRPGDATALPASSAKATCSRATTAHSASAACKAATAGVTATAGKAAAACVATEPTAAARL
jgi:hypothetical protein